MQVRRLPLRMVRVPEGSDLMAVSKRLRFEILRRDNHTCRYCGAKAPDVNLTVDHVLPVTLGGTDAATNLVAACPECNAGKSSSHPDQHVIANVSDETIRWSRAVKLSADLMLKDQDESSRYVDYILNCWVSRMGWETIPDDHRMVIEGFRSRGMPAHILEDAADIAIDNPRISSHKKWAYFMGVAWSKMRELEGVARHLYENGKDGS
jgi:5-methylcytosine-specific restriction endonuclease McrA